MKLVDVPPSVEGLHKKLSNNKKQGIYQAGTI